MSRRPRMPFPRTIAEIASDATAFPALAARLREADIWRLWPEVVGKAIATQALPVRIIKGTLTVAVSSGPWKQELGFLKEMMIEKLNDRLGSQIVKQIVLTSGSIKAFSEEPTEAVPRKKKLTARQLAHIEAESAAITDPETRAAFAGLMKAHCER